MNVEEKRSYLESNNYENQGFVNGWNGEEPPPVKCHKELNHKTESQSSIYGDHVYWCNDCKIFWSMDSSD